MALVKFGGGIIQLSGKIAGNVFARNRYGNTVRALTKPVNPNTALQQVVRGLVASLSTIWSLTLTAAQRTSWGLYGDSVDMKNRLGETVNLTGFNHFVRTNVPLLQAGGVRVDPGPVVFELPTKDPLMTCAISEATQVVTIVFDDTKDWVDEDGAHLMISVGSPQNPQRNFFAGPWRYAGKISGDSETAPTTPDTTISVPFVCTELQRVWVKARIVRADGRLSEEFTANCFCGA